MAQAPEEFTSLKAVEPLSHIAARAAMVSGSAEVVTRVLTVLLSIATARVLEPVEVGFLGLAVIVVGVVSMLSFYPETAAITARGGESESRYAFASSVIRASILAVALAAIWLSFSWIARHLTGNDNVGPLRDLVLVLMWMPLLELLGGYPQVVMQRRLDLGLIARLQILQPALFVAVAIALLITGYGYIGVAWANVVSGTVVTVMLWYRLFSTGRAGWGGWPSKMVWRDTWRGTVKVLIGGFGGYLGGRVDNLLVAGSIGPAAMSYYSMAWNASRTPANVFARAINFVLVPALARIQDDPIRVQRALKECVRNSYLLLAPACGLMFVSAPQLVSYLLGTKWLLVVPVLRIMCFTVLLAPILHASAALLIGTGRAHLTGLATLFHLSALAVLVPVLASLWGIRGAAYADMIATSLLTIVLCITAHVATRQIGLSLPATAALPVLAASLVSLLAWVAGSATATDAARLAAECSIILIGYPLALTVLGGKSRLFDLTSILRRVFRRSMALPEYQSQPES